GESVAEGTIGKWLKQPGDHVAKYEPLLEGITAKVTAGVPGRVRGVLTEIRAREGETVPNNAEIAVIDEAGEAGAKPEKAAAAAPAATPAAPAAAAPAAPAAAVATPPAPARGPAGSDERPTRAPEPRPVMA